jgi:hypothetical protein
MVIPGAAQPVSLPPLIAWGAPAPPKEHSLPLVIRERHEERIHQYNRLKTHRMITRHDRRADTDPAYYRPGPEINREYDKLGAHMRRQRGDRVARREANRAAALARACTAAPGAAALGKDPIDAGYPHGEEMSESVTPRRPAAAPPCGAAKENSLSAAAPPCGAAKEDNLSEAEDDGFLSMDEVQ